MGVTAALHNIAAVIENGAGQLLKRTRKRRKQSVDDGAKTLWSRMARGHAPLEAANVLQMRCLGARISPTRREFSRLPRSG